jgi:hypothetical protein
MEVVVALELVVSDVVEQEAQLLLPPRHPWRRRH